MRVYTHGSKRGRIELLKSEDAALRRAIDVLREVTKHASTKTSTLAGESAGRMALVLQYLENGEPQEVVA